MNPDDLRREDGSIDARTILSDRPTSDRLVVTPQQCAQWREEASNGASAHELGDKAEYRHDTVARHLRGDCQHGGDLELEYDEHRKRWFTADPDASCERCGGPVANDDLRYCEDCHTTLVQRGVVVKATRGD